MTRILGHYISLEMLALCAAELGLSFLLIYAMLVAGAAPDMAAPGLAALPLHPASALLAARLVGTIGATSLAIGLYRPEICLERRRLLFNAAIVVAIAMPALLLAHAAVRGRLPGTLLHELMWLAKVLFAWTICLFVTRFVFSSAVRLKLFARRVVVVGDGIRAAAMADAIRDQQARFFELAVLPRPAGDDALPAAAALRQAKVWGVVVACDDPAGEHFADHRAGSEMLGRVAAEVLLGWRTQGIRVIDDVEFREQQLGRIDIDHMAAERLALGGGFRVGRLSAVLRRGLDVVVSLLLLLLALPVMLVTAIAIKFDSDGPIFYRQLRVGQHGREFPLLKFRSMRVDAEQGRPIWAAQNDPRVTRVGAFIRATRIDELPQIFCVLRGDMGFVGPRPERPHFVEQLAEAIPFYRHRSAVKPGITGWAQVNFPYGASVEDAREKLSYDLYYVKNRSLFLDLLILISTVRVILFQEGAR
ncbi:MAG TPA: TIGR03013 family XrtA/PEP-CTERM system glycosyltransferase [Acetobacteraceae bacterium]|nr:TIGR03013 family XrtA/PEP-CTERM system glycosyltransferase [Acetobacteraceae bacterium]